MKKFIGRLVSNETTLKVLVVILVLGCVGIMELIAYRETVNWVSNEIYQIIQEDNTDFFVLGPRQ